ncbi:MAG TPA: diphthine--ammonia ligase [Candidatus Bathyarchaeia archaeon]|nr:diphthine--ammonia ligase [Candidatus Bathyarchaeia archaeon]
MRLIALISGGKDSVCALNCALREHEVVQLVNVQAVEDSFLYHVPCAGLTRLISEAVDIPLVSGASFSHEDELILLKTLLRGAEADGVVAGTIASNYQMSRLKKICAQLELQLYTPLWNKGSERLLRAMAGSMDIIVVQVAAYGMNESWLGRKLDEEAVDDLCVLHRKHGVHIMGEGGEYETLVVDAPIFKRRIKVMNYDKKWFSEQWRGCLEIHEFKLEDK